jgi:IS30 family transposase
MAQVYNHLSSQERNFLQRYLNLGRSRRWIAVRLKRFAATVSREVKQLASQTSEVIGTIEAHVNSMKAAADRSASRHRSRVFPPSSCHNPPENC